MASALTESLWDLPLVEGSHSSIPPAQDAAAQVVGFAGQPLFWAGPSAGASQLQSPLGPPESLLLHITRGSASHVLPSLPAHGPPGPPPGRSPAQKPKTSCKFEGGHHGPEQVLLGYLYLTQGTGGDVCGHFGCHSPEVDAVVTSGG